MVKRKGMNTFTWNNCWNGSEGNRNIQQSTLKTLNPSRCYCRISSLQRSFVRAGYQCSTVKSPAASPVPGKAAAAVCDMLSEELEGNGIGREICTGAFTASLSLLWAAGEALQRWQYSASGSLGGYCGWKAAERRCSGGSLVEPSALSGMYLCCH